jgi:hypothetical protein
MKKPRGRKSRVTVPLKPTHNLTHLSAAPNALPSSKSAGNMLAGAKELKFVISKLAMSTYFLNPIFFYFTHLSAALNAPLSSKSAGNMGAGTKRVKFVVSKLATSSYFLKPIFFISLT